MKPGTCHIILHQPLRIAITRKQSLSPERHSNLQPTHCTHHGSSECKTRTTHTTLAPSNQNKNTFKGHFVIRERTEKREKKDEERDPIREN